MARTSIANFGVYSHDFYVCTRMDHFRMYVLILQQARKLIVCHRVTLRSTRFNSFLFRICWARKTNAGCLSFLLSLHALDANRSQDLRSVPLGPDRHFIRAVLTGVHDAGEGEP